MTFEDLARELDDTYSVGYGDRDKALGEFGAKHLDDLIALEKQGRTIEELVDAGKISPPAYFAKLIKRGMKRN